MRYLLKHGVFAGLLFFGFCAAASVEAEAQKTAREQAERIDSLYRESYILEKRGEYEEARRVALQIIQRADSYDARLRYAWLTLQVGDFEEAAKAYRRVLELVPESQDAQLGLQLAHIRAQNWDEAREVGRALLEQAPDNYYALSRHAFVRFMQGDYEVAEDLYRRALTISEGDPEMLLGLGFTRVRRGDAEQGAKMCLQAAAELPGDSRVERCLEEARSAPGRSPVSLYGGAYLSYFGYTDPWSLRDIKSVSALVGVETDFGPGLNLAVAHSQTTLRYEADDFRQTALIGGLFWIEEAFRIDAGGGVLLSNDTGLDQTFFGILSGRVLPGRFGGSLAAAGTFYESFPVFQIDPRIIAVITPRVSLAAGPEVIIMPEADDADWSGHVGVDIAWSDAVFTYLHGWGGHRRYAVDAGGLSVWTNGDRFVAGYTLGGKWAPIQNLGFVLEFRQSFADRQSGRAHHFSLLGGTFGIAAGF